MKISGFIFTPVLLAVFLFSVGNANANWEWSHDNGYYDSYGQRGWNNYQGHGYGQYRHKRDRVQLGPRPYYLVDDMDDSWLKRTLES